MDVRCYLLVRSICKQMLKIENYLGRKFHLCPVMGFYIEIISGLQNGLFENVFFACFCKVCHFLMSVKNNISQSLKLQGFYKTNTCCLSFMVTNIITTLFHNNQYILGICPTRGCTKRA